MFYDFKLVSLISFSQSAENSIFGKLFGLGTHYAKCWSITWRKIGQILCGNKFVFEEKELSEHEFKTCFKVF